MRLGFRTALLSSKASTTHALTYRVFGEEVSEAVSTLGLMVSKEQGI